MPAPTLELVKSYLGVSHSWTDAEVASALKAEKAGQARRCRVPADSEDWPADLVEALCRRVAANLANRGLPLGVSAQMSEMSVQTTRVGGLDREVRRLEAPHRKVVIG